VVIWDNGTFVLEKFEDKEILFNLSGQKLKGPYALIKTKFGKQNSWLFF